MIERMLTSYWAGKVEGFTEMPQAYRASGARFPRAESALSAVIVNVSDAMYGAAERIDPMPRGEGGTWATEGARCRIATALYRASWRASAPPRYLRSVRYPQG